MPSIHNTQTLYQITFSSVGYIAILFGKIKEAHIITFNNWLTEWLHEAEEFLDDDDDDGDDDNNSTGQFTRAHILYSIQNNIQAT
jgi:hypothetical protein